MHFATCGDEQRVADQRCDGFAVMLLQRILKLREEGYRAGAVGSGRWVRVRAVSLGCGLVRLRVAEGRCANGAGEDTDKGKQRKLNSTEATSAEHVG